MVDFWSKKLLMGVEKKVTFKITPSPTSATVKINGVTTKSVEVKPGETVSWEVSYSGYFTQTGSQVVDVDTTKTVTLKSRTTTIATSSMTMTTKSSVRMDNAAVMFNRRTYVMSYSFTKGKSYTVSYKVSAPCNATFADTSTSNAIDTSTGANSGRASTRTQNVVATVYSSSNTGVTTTTQTITKTFTASANASYLVICNKLYAGYTDTYPTIGSVTIKDNS